MAVLRRRRGLRRQAHQPPRHTATTRLLLAASSDGSCASIARLAAALEERDRSEVLVATAIAPVPYDVALKLPEARAAVYDDSAQLAARTVQAKLRRILGRDAWEVRPVVGWPGDAINALAQSWNATMLLVGVHRHGLADRLTGGETAIEIIRAAKIPVLAVHDGLREIPTHLLAATAFDDASMAAARAAAALLPRGGGITLAHASTFADPHNTGDFAELMRAGINARLAEQAETLRKDTGLRVETWPLVGPPSEALLAFARRARCDLISLGGANRGWIERALLGSVRTDVLHGARGAVLIAPPDHR